MAETQIKPRVRIAPSPTGDPHVGTAYIALFNYALAKQQGGQFILRIEDTDQARSTPESEQAIFDSLNWLGLHWDEGPDVGGPKGPYRQSERLDIYTDYAKQLVASGHAYWCTCSPERLSALREQQKEAKTSFGYDGHCRNRPAEEVQAEIEQGAPAVIRLKTPQDGETTFEDLLRGPINIGNKELDDQVLLKADGFPTYHLANVVDDHLMEITHILRGEEWISSTPKHILLYQAFGWEPPEYVHLPLLRNADKSKVSKRKNPVSLDFFKQAGYFPDALVNFLGLMAFTFEDETEIFSLEEFVQNFEPKRISLGGPVFDLQKLDWLNGIYFREKRSDDQVLVYLQEQLFSDDYLRAIVPLVKERINKSVEFVDYADFFFSDEIEFDATIMLLNGHSKKESGKLWDKLIGVLEAQTRLTTEGVESALKAFMAEKGLKPKQIYFPMRMMITGKKGSPPLFETMEVLGKERVRTRMRNGLKAFKQSKI
ncbi:MAG: glutamate--tRNA ligase [Myxococcales bacterium]|nr:glutamate--tRNA ligase [Myxococcales bacterium]